MKVPVSASRGAKATACTRMSNDIPTLLQMLEAARDVLIGRDVHGEGDVRSQLLGERADAIGHPLDVGKGQRRALTVHGLRDAPGDGAIRREPHDEGALAVQKTHRFPQYSSSLARASSVFSPAADPRSTYMTSRCPARIWWCWFRPFQLLSWVTDTWNCREIL